MLSWRAVFCIPLLISFGNLQFLTPLARALHYPVHLSLHCFASVQVDASIPIFVFAIQFSAHRGQRHTLSLRQHVLQTSPLHESWRGLEVQPTIVFLAQVHRQNDPFFLLQRGLAPLNTLPETCTQNLQHFRVRTGASWPIHRVHDGHSLLVEIALL